MNEVFISGFVKYPKKFENVTSFKLSLSRGKEKGNMLLPVKILGSEDMDIAEGSEVCIASGMLDSHEYNGKRIVEILCFPRNLYVKAKSSQGEFPKGYPLPPADSYGPPGYDTPSSFPPMPEGF